MTEQSAAATIPSDWLNDGTDYQQCFVCGGRNPIGLHVHYRQEGDRIVTEFTGGPQHQGFPGVVHGGLISTLLDETMGRTPLVSRTWVMTGRLEVRYRQPVPTGQRLTISAWLTRSRKSAFESRGEVRLDDGTLLADARGLFIKAPEDIIKQAADAHPELGDYFNQGFFRGDG